MAASDWIKLTKGLPDKPAFHRVRRMLGLRDPDALIGRLFRFWAWMDECAVPDEGGDRDDGFVPHLSVEDVDERFGKGFCAAMTAVDWMGQRDGGIVLPRYFSHNGTTGKQRAETQKRVASHRQRVTKVKRECNANPVTEALPERDREREEDISASAEIYPRASEAAVEGAVAAAGRWSATVRGHELSDSERAKLMRLLGVLAAAPPVQRNGQPVPAADLAAEAAAWHQDRRTKFPNWAYAERCIASTIDEWRQRGVPGSREFEARERPFDPPGPERPPVEEIVSAAFAARRKGVA